MRAIQGTLGKRRWRITAVGAGILILSGVGIPGRALAATASTSATCTQVTIIGARGSGQPATGPFGGFGPQVDKAISVIEGDLQAKNISYGAESVDYPAESVDVLSPSAIDFIDWSDYITNHLDPFLNSITTGVSVSVGDAESAQQTCNSKIIMVGYSQGAMVVHQAELQLKSQDPAAYNLIIGTVLVADGNRVPNSASKLFGSSPAAGEGIESWIYHTALDYIPFPDVPIPGSTADICNNSDIVCDTSLNALENFSSSAQVHTQSYADCSANNTCTYGTALIDGADWVGKLAASKV